MHMEKIIWRVLELIGSYKAQSLALPKACLEVPDQLVQIWAYSRAFRSPDAKLTGPFLKQAYEVAEVSPYLRSVMAPVLVRYRLLALVKKWADAEQYQSSGLDDTYHQLHHCYIADDHTGCVSCLKACYKITGNAEHLEDALKVAHEHLPLNTVYDLLPAVLLSSPERQARYLRSLAIRIRSENELGELELLERHLPRQKELAPLHEHIKAEIAYLKENFGDAITIAYSALENLELTKNQELNFYSVLALAEEKKGRYRVAAGYFSKQGDLAKRDDFGPSEFQRLCVMDDSFSGRVDDDESTQRYAIITGFPRSGTTLLDNALDSHADVTVIEERNSFFSTKKIAHAFDGGGESDMNGMLDVMAGHRARYFTDLNRLAGAQSNNLIIDKTPMMAAHAPYLKKVLPKVRYIFCIRHPYDVIISNFRQNYRQNLAMAAFNDMGSSVSLYDFTMSRWFNNFRSDSDHVHYLYYDYLVTDFENTLRKVLRFLDLDWDDNVLNFASASRSRRGKTPSYGKVRKGLSLGVQSSYQNYLFLFDDYCRSKLDPWVEFFGYTVEEPEQ